MLIGDFNARIGLFQNSSIEELNTQTDLFSTRNSKDETLNRNGRMLIELLESFGFWVLNGVSRSDVCGELTFVGGQGSSVIDLCAVNGDWLQAVNDFEVLLATFTSHLPILVNANFLHETISQSLEKIPKLKWIPQEGERFRERLNRHVRSLPPPSPSAIDQLGEQISEIVRLSASRISSPKQLQPRNKWYDSECMRFRKKSFAFLKLFRRFNLDHFKSAYLEANKIYKQVCEAKKLNYTLNLATLLERCKDSKNFWNNVRELGGNNRMSSCVLQAEVLASHFRSLLTCQDDLHSFHYACPDTVDNLLDSVIVLDELELALFNMKNNKSPGFDGIPVEFLKNSSLEFKQYLLSFYNNLYDSACIPTSFNKAVIFSIFKKGDASLPENYRGISILNSIRKVFARILYKRLINWVESNNRLSMFQAGFREGFSTVDHIFALSSIANKFIQKKMKMYACFIDLKAAFDTVNRQALIYKMASLGISRKFLNIYEKFLCKTYATVWDGAEVSNWFQTTAGVPQGCILSPILFALYIDDISDNLPGGVCFSDIRIKVLLYADDLVMLADNPSSLQLQINRVQTYCNIWDLKINSEKTKIMVFEARSCRRLREERWFLNNQPIEIVQEFKYLGVLMSANGSFNKHVQRKSKEAKVALNIMWPTFFSNENIDLGSKYRVFQATINTCLCYGIQVFGHTYFEEFELIQRLFFKRLFRLPNSTPTYAIHVESGIAPIYIKNLKLHADFLIRVMSKPSSNLHTSIMKVLLRTEASPFKEWTQLARLHNVSLELNEFNIDNWQDIFSNVIAKVDENIYLQHLNRASSSSTREIYKNLSHSLNTNATNYFNNSLSARAIGTIFRARVEILNLNYIPHRSDLPLLCNYCNRNERDDIYHFIAICPILQEIRRLYFQHSVLSREQMFGVMNGSVGWTNLFMFCDHAINYRRSFPTF